MPGPVEQHETQGADQGAVLVPKRDSRHDKMLAAEGHQIEHARLAALHHFAQAAGGQHFFDFLAENTARVADADLFRVFVIDPDDTRLAIDRDGAFALSIEVVEQQRHGHRPKAFGRYADGQAVEVKVVAGDCHGFELSGEVRPIMEGAGCRGQGSRSGLRVRTPRWAATWPTAQRRTPRPGRAAESGCRA